MIREALLEAYFRKVPNFKHKWRLLRPVGHLVNGLPVRSRYGIRMHLDVYDLTNGFCMLGKYGDVVAKEVGALQAGDCFIDVGANCGLFTLMASRAVGRSGKVIAFEPNLKTFGTLVRNLALNDVENVLPFNMAVCDSTTLLGMQANPRHSGRASVSDHAEGSGVKTVHGIALRDFSALHAMIGDRPTTLKIDVEGFELMAIQGTMDILMRDKTRKLIVEINDSHLGKYGNSSSEIYERMSAIGYKPKFGEGLRRHYDEVFIRSLPG